MAVVAIMENFYRVRVSYVRPDHRWVTVLCIEVFFFFSFLSFFSFSKISCHSDARGILFAMCIVAEHSVKPRIE